MAKHFKNKRALLCSTCRTLRGYTKGLNDWEWEEDVPNYCPVCGDRFCDEFYEN